MIIVLVTHLSADSCDVLEFLKYKAQILSRGAGQAVPQDDRVEAL